MAKKKAPKFISETEMKIKTACNSAIEQMQAKVLAHYKKHPDSAFSGHYLVELEKTVKAVYKDLGLSVGKSFKTGIKKGMEDFYNKAAEDLKTHGTYNHILGKPNVELVKHYLNSSFEEVAMHTTKMSFEHVKALRQMSAEILRTASLTGASRADITKQFLERAEEIPGFQFVAANGAVWKNETYFRMLARTELMNAARAAYDDKCAKEGCDVVELTYSGDSCDHCTPFEGTQFSLTGATKGMPTKQDLIDAGVFHPNCTHSYTAVPNWDIPDDIEDEAPKKDDAEQPQEKPQDVKPSKVAKPKKTVEPSEAKPKKAPKAKKTAEANPADQTQNAPSPTAVIKPKKTTKKQTTDNPAPSPVPAPVAPEVKPSEDKKPEPKPEPKPEVKPADEAKPEKKQKPSDKPKDEVKPEPKKDADGFPKNPDDLKVVDDSPGGTTGAKIVEDEDGKKYVMKKNGKTSAEHVESEAAVDNFYLKMGIRVPRCKLYRDENGNVVKFSEYLENARRLGDWWSSASASERREMLKKLRSGFDIDVLLGNWDVIGDAIDNILIDKDGNPWRIDNGGSAQFRAQGAKKLDDQWKTGFVDDLWSMRETGTKKQFFGDIDTVELLNSIVNRDYSEALKELPDDMRAVVEKRLKEFKELAGRGNEFVETSKYTPQSIDKVLRYSHDLSKDGMRERIPDKVEPTGYSHTVKDFGWFRSDRSGGSSNQTAEQQKDANIQKINYHNGAKSGNSDAGDHKPNQAKIDAAIALKPELEKLAKQGNNGAKYYLDRIAKIEEAAKNNTTLSGKNVSVDVPIYSAQTTQNSKNVAQNAPKSFTSQIYDYISKQNVEYNGKKIQLDPYFIKRAQSQQSINSFNEDACKIKMCRLNAMGITPKDAEPIYFTGEDPMAKPDQKKNWKKTVDYYKNNPDLLARDTETYLRYQSGVQLMLEKTDFPGNDHATRTVILVRNEHDDVVANSEVGDELKAKHGVNESHGTFRTVSLDHYRRNCTVTRVPYSRISGFYFAEQYPGQGDCGFLDDDENEFTADTSGLKTLFVKKDVGSGEDTEPFRNTYLKWEKGGYKKLTK